MHMTLSLRPAIGRLIFTALILGEFVPGMDFRSARGEPAAVCSSKDFSVSISALSECIDFRTRLTGTPSSYSIFDPDLNDVPKRAGGTLFPNNMEGAKHRREDKTSVECTTAQTQPIKPPSPAGAQTRLRVNQTLSIHCMTASEFDRIFSTPWPERDQDGFVIVRDNLSRLEVLRYRMHATGSKDSLTIRVGSLTFGRIYRLWVAMPDYLKTSDTGKTEYAWDFLFEGIPNMLTIRIRTDGDTYSLAGAYTEPADFTCK